jgi:acetylornithine deacetylase/succinyl-diaminopimelate desuccinylase-like protein
MDLLGLFKKVIIRGIDTLSGKASIILNRPKKPTAPLADRLLADAFRLGELPSPREREEERATFVVERLTSLGLRFTVDEGGNILEILHPSPHSFQQPEPLLLFTRLGSERWNSLESLGKLEVQFARGAGLADVLGPAALLSIAEGYAAGRYFWKREVHLYFSALQFDDPGNDAFLSITSQSERTPMAAIGVRGFSLGCLSSHSLGFYRVELSLTQEEGTGEAVPVDAGGNAVVIALSTLAGIFHALADNGEGESGGIKLYIRRIEALTAYGRTPVEGALELDLESADKTLLDRALEKVRAEVEAMNAGDPHPGKVQCSLRIVSSTPPGNPSVNEGLRNTLLEAMKELKIKTEEESGADPASFLSSLNIPALSVGIARGREGLNRDKVEIASIEKGRLLLERLITRLTGEKNG